MTWSAPSRVVMRCEEKVGKHSQKWYTFSFFVCVYIHLICFAYMIPAWLLPLEWATKILGTVGEELHPFLYLDTSWCYGIPTVIYQYQPTTSSSSNVVNRSFDSLIHFLHTQSIHFYFLSIISLLFHSTSSQKGRRNLHEAIKEHKKSSWRQQLCSLW